jgi:hypothetical protein
MIVSLIDKTFLTFLIKASSEYQELRWLRLAVLKRRKAGDPALLDGIPFNHGYFYVTELR